MIKVIIFSILFSQTLYALECKQSSEVKAVDLSTQFGPIRDQDGTGWCYAFAGADILGHKLAQKNKNYTIKNREDQISAVAMSLAFNKDKRLERYHQFEQDMNLFNKLTNNPEYQKNLEKKLDTLRTKMKKKSEEIIPKGSKHYGLLTKYNNVLDRCRDEKRDYTCVEKTDLGIDRLRVEDALNGNVKYLDLAIEFLGATGEVEQIKDLIERNGDVKPDFLEEEGGYSYEAINSMVQSRLCLESEVPSYDYKYSQEFKEIINGDHEKLSEVVRAVSSVNDLLNKSFYAMTRAITTSKEKACLSAKVGKMIFPNLEINEIAKILKQGLSNDYDPLDELYKRSCKKKNNLNVAAGELTQEILGRNTPFEYIMKDVDKTLDKGDPVVLGYESEIFEVGGDLLTKQLDESTSGHASVIVGKKFNCKSGEVEYIIRNSWGPDSCLKARMKYRTSELIAAELKIEEDNTACDDKCVALPLKTADDIVDKCFNSCFDKLSKSEEEFDKKVEKITPFRCENGHYIAPKSLIQKGLNDTVHF